MGISQRSVQVHPPVMSVFEKLFSIKKIHFKRSVIFVVNQKGGVGKICFIIICEIRWVNSSIYIFFKVFRHGIMVLIKKLLCLLERAVKSYEAII